MLGKAGVAPSEIVSPIVHATTLVTNALIEGKTGRSAMVTTTGFGDITLTGSLGRMISVVVMICGVTLFLRLAQVLFRPVKVRETCRKCGLSLHDADAVHCKHCGATIHIETEGDF